MHGRLKVRTTEEQAERKRLEREKKLKAYKFAMSECLSRINQEKYDQTGLKICEEILVSNPDIQTLWNLRKNTIKLFEETYSEEDLIKIYVDEMSLTEICLKKNPKSYPSWYHRQWCLLRSNSKDFGQKNQSLNWKNELNLCSKFLNQDERNFHCWRHRFFVVRHGNLDKKHELDFTYEKISSNFSNYSSWHYRNKLIEELYFQNQIDDQIFKNELNLIENAVFTDPNDQSAWIYQKWLLLEHQKSLIRILTFSSISKTISIHLNKEIDLYKDLKFIKLNNFDFKFDEKSLRLEDNFWQVESINDQDELKELLENLVQSDRSKIKIEIMIRNNGFPTEFVLDLNEDKNLYEFKSKLLIRDLKLDSEILINHLKNMMELNQFEKETSKWCILKLVELMSIIDYSQYKETIISYLEKLANQVDLFRKNYYLEVKQKLIENNS